MNAKLAPILVVCVVGVLCSWATRGPRRIGSGTVSSVAVSADLAPAVERVNQFFAERWRSNDIQPAEAADELLVLRRLSLAMIGSVPSIEEVRQFEADREPQRLDRWTLRLLHDQRFSAYFAVRLSRCFVGADDGQFIVFRRDRFSSWLGEQLHEGRPYDGIVRQMVASKGLWTGQPESNFVTAAFANDELDENKLAARTARAFLGQSMDCAQCHDHVFADWKQQQFQGIAAQFGQTEVGGLGVHDKASNKFTVVDRKTQEDREVSPSVPFHPEWLPTEGSPREQFAHWLTHPENRRFDRAIANRVWGLMFGKPFIAPVDDLPNPPDDEHRDILDLLGQDFRQHDCDLRRLVQVIAGSQCFRAASLHPSEDADVIEKLNEHWAVFPLTRLRPEQIIGSMQQASYIQTIDQNSHLAVRFIRFTSENDFVKAYGDLGDQELVDRSGTIPQALLRMNGEVTRDAIKTGPLSTASRIAKMCQSNQEVVEVSYLACVARRPTAEEEAHFVGLLDKRRDKDLEPSVEDIFWTLFNAPEFSWNH